MFKSPPEPLETPYLYPSSSIQVDNNCTNNQINDNDLHSAVPAIVENYEEPVPANQGLYQDNQHYLLKFNQIDSE